MEANFSLYRHAGFTWLIVNGRTYKTANLDEALDLLDKMAKEMEQPISEPEEA